MSGCLSDKPECPPRRAAPYPPVHTLHRSGNGRGVSNSRGSSLADLFRWVNKPTKPRGWMILWHGGGGRGGRPEGGGGESSSACTNSFQSREQLWAQALGCPRQVSRLAPATLLSGEPYRLRDGVKTETPLSLAHHGRDTSHLGTRVTAAA